MENDMTNTTFLTPNTVASRYNGAITVRTLANWRSIGQGPDYVKIGGKVLYPLTSVQDWEKSRKRTIST